MTIPEWWDDLVCFTPYETYKSAEGIEVRSFPYPERMDEDTMKRLDRARGFAGMVFTVTSSFRPGDPRAHGKGKAVDIRIKGIKQRTKVFRAMDRAGFPRLGIYDKHIHGDTDYTRPLGIWGGKSE